MTPCPKSVNVRFFLSAVCLTVATTAESAAPPTWPEILAAANKEARVVLYTVQAPAVMDRIKADFSKVFPGIQLEMNRVTSGQMISKLEQERKTGADGADAVITTDMVWLEERAKEGVLKVPSGPAAKGWPSAYLLSGAVTILALEPLVIVYNTELVKTPVVGYQDLLRPEFKGRLGTSDLVAITVVAWYDWLEKTLGPDFIAKFAAQKPRLYVGTVPATQATISGEVAVSAFSNTSVSMPLIEGGAPLKVVVPSPSFGIRYAGGAPGWSRRPNAAQAFMDYLMSQRGQTAWSGKGDAASPLPNVPGSLNAATVSPFDPNGYPPAKVSEYRKKWNALFKQ